MSRRLSVSRSGALALSCATVCTVALADATPGDVRSPATPATVLDVEVDQGAVLSNTLQRYNNPSTTRFDTADYTGHALTTGRVTLSVPVGAPGAGHEVRLEIVPLQVSGTAPARTPIVYDGETFAQGRPLTSTSSTPIASPTTYRCFAPRHPTAGRFAPAERSRSATGRSD